jgi:hypothetical protein
MRKQVLASVVFALAGCGGRSFEHGAYDDDGGGSGRGAEGGTPAQAGSAGAHAGAGTAAVGGVSGADAVGGSSASAAAGEPGIQGGAAGASGLPTAGGPPGGGRSGAGGVGGFTEVGDPIGATPVVEASAGRPSAEFDPNVVYLFGALSPSACSSGALTPLSDPGDVRASLDSCDGRSPKVARDRRLVYNHQRSDDPYLRKFVPEARVEVPTRSRPWEDDELIPTQCGAGRPGEFWLDPDGELVYRCEYCDPDDCDHLLESGADYPVPDGYDLGALGYGDSALLRALPSWELSFRAGSNDPVPTGEDGSTAIRAHPGGFWLLRSEAPDESPTRVNIGLDGEVTEDGKFPNLPASSIYDFFEAEGKWHRCAFDAEGRAYCFGISAFDSYKDQVIRFDLEKDVAEVVYTEDMRPLVWIHISELITGP